MHLLASLAAHGWHAAAWRVTGAAAFAGAAPFRAMAKTAEQGGLDAVLLGLPTAPRARRDGGKVDGIRLDPLPLVAAMIGATERIGLCAWWPGDVAEPFHVARVFATLDHLASGRTGWIAGLEGARGTGHPLSPHQLARHRRGLGGAPGRADRRRAPALGQLGGSRLRRRPGERHFRRPDSRPSDRACRKVLHRARAAQRAASGAGPAGDPASRRAGRTDARWAPPPVRKSCWRNAPPSPRQRPAARTGAPWRKSRAAIPRGCASSFA